MNIDLLLRSRRQLRRGRRFWQGSRSRDLLRLCLQCRHNNRRRADWAGYLMPAHRGSHLQTIAARGATEREQLILRRRKRRGRRQLRSRKLGEHFRRRQHQRAVTEWTGNLLSRERAIDLNVARAQGTRQCYRRHCLSLPIRACALAARDCLLATVVS